MKPSQQPFHIGSRLVEPSLNRISGSGENIRLEPKAMDVLVELVRRPNQVVSRDELLETVWAGTVVTEDVLTRAVSALRRALGDDPKTQQVIETIPKTGYRLIAPVRLRPERSPSKETPEHAPNETGIQNRAIRWGGAVILLIGLGLLWIQRSTTNVSRTYPTEVLTSYTGSESNPALSPDGSQVAFAWRGSSGDNLDVYTRLVSGEGLLRLTDSEAYDFRPTWSPDGNRLAFIRFGDSCAVYVVSALGGPARQLAPCGDTIYPDPAWSPDGQWIAMNGRESPDDPFGIYLISVNTLERRRLTQPPGASWGDHDPSFSPGGEYLAFTRSASEGMQDLFLVDLDSGDEEQLTDEARNIWGHTWVGSSTVVFSSNRTGRASLWLLDLREELPAWIGVAADDSKFPTWSNARLVFSQSTGDVNIWEFTVGDSVATRAIATSSRWDMHPSYSPDGSHIAFTSNRSGHYEIWKARADGTEEVRLTDFQGPFTSSPKWSPSGREIVFTSRPDGQADIYLVASDGGVPQNLTKDADDSDELAPFWTEDGQAVLLSSNRTGQWEIYQLELSTRKLVQLTREGGFAAQPHKDGLLFYAKQNQLGVWRRSLDGSHETQVLSDLDTRDWGSWRIYDETIIYVKRGRPTVVVRASFDGVLMDTLFVPPHAIPVGDPALDVSPDGQTLLVGQVDRVESDLMLVDRFP